MEKITIQPLSAGVAKKLTRFSALVGNAIKENRDEDGNVSGYKWSLKNANVDVQVALLGYHFPITVRDNNVYLYDDYRQEDIEVQGAITINAYLDLVKQAYKFTGGAKVNKDDLRTIYSLSSKHATFEQWDGTRRAFTILDEFFNLDTFSIATDIPDKEIRNQMRLAFMTWAMQHVARLKGMGLLTTGDIQYSLFPILLSMDKEIGKSSFLNHLLNAVGSTGETNLEMILNPIQRGRLFSQHQALVLNELSPFEVARNIEKIKELATLNAYTVDEKFEKAVDLIRETAIIATSNRPAGDFSQHQSERRIQLITIVRKDKPTNFEDYPFGQFWAELAWIADTMPKRELKKFLRWGTKHTIQPDGDDDSSVFEFIRKIANDSFDKNADSPEDIISTPKGVIILRKALVERGKTSKNVLDSLGIKPQLDTKSGEYMFSDTVFMRRLRSFLSQFASKTGQMRETKKDGTRGFLVTETVDDFVDAKEDLDVDALNEKYEAMRNVYTTEDKRTGLHRRIADALAWSGDALDEPAERATFNISGFHGHLVVIEMSNINAPEDVPVENIDNITRAYFWLSDDNVTRLDYNDSFDITGKTFAMYNTSDMEFETDCSWLETIQENTGIGWLLNFRTNAELAVASTKQTETE